MKQRLWVFFFWVMLFSMGVALHAKYFNVQAAVTTPPQIYLVVADRVASVPQRNMEDCRRMAGVFFTSNPKKIVLCGEQIGGGQ